MLELEAGAEALKLKVKKMKKMSLLVAIAFFIIVVFCLTIQVSALTANSSSCSVSMFGTGLAAANPSSTNYNSISLSEARATTQNAESETYTANIGFFDNTYPTKVVSISSYSIYPGSAVAVSIIRLYISASNAQAVWAKITRPDGADENVILSNNDYVYYTAGIIGRYNTTFYANSSAGAIVSVIDYFEIFESSATPQLPSSGDGGRIEECNYIWDCTPWSICSEGQQKRECKNIGTCKGEEGKPSQEINCSELLFDVILKLEDVTLGKKNNLIFNVSLIETKSIEKIDVYIKYSIIDKNNTEIFSQTETRAIQENLSYQREIDEIKLNDGEYILRVDILYGYLQRAFAEQKFRVEGQEIKTIQEETSIPEVSKETPKGMTGMIVSNLNKMYKSRFLLILILLMIIIFILLLFGKFIKKIRTKKELKGLKSIRGLKVYTSGGIEIGKVKEVMLGKNKIESLKINLNKKIKSLKFRESRTKGIYINYRDVKGISNIVLVDDELLKHLGS
ncbi:MAG: PRC-barrel domain-containing protein [Nanoarchaeota archaeon]|nr:PRC-barrel domain-containing protein [Nanoarchaeota archaeon]